MEAIVDCTEETALGVIRSPTIGRETGENTRRERETSPSVGMDFPTVVTLMFLFLYFTLPLCLRHLFSKTLS